MCSSRLLQEAAKSARTDLADIERHNCESAEQKKRPQAKAWKSGQAELFWPHCQRDQNNEIVVLAKGDIVLEMSNAKGVKWTPGINFDDHFVIVDSGRPS